MNCTKMKVCGCTYKDDKDKYRKGIYILNRKTNTFTVVNIKLEKVVNPQCVVTQECSIGNILMDL